MKNVSQRKVISTIVHNVDRIISGSYLGQCFSYIIVSKTKQSNVDNNTSMRDVI